MAARIMSKEGLSGSPEKVAGDAIWRQTFESKVTRMASSPRLPNALAIRGGREAAVRQHRLVSEHQ